MEDQNSVRAGKDLVSQSAESPRPAPVDGFNRQLKFRAYDVVKGKWIDGGYGFHILGEAMLLGGLFCDYGILELNNIRITQFTGILDRNGKDVYEGDIVRHEYGGNHIVHWIAETAGFFVGNQNWPLSRLCTPRIEVVGNVFTPHNALEREAEITTIG